jgi:probable rRNA maturation factor
MINVIINSDSKYPVDKLAIQGAVVEVLQENQIYGNIEIGVSIVNDRKMHEFNRKYRGIDAPTNILTFALEDLGGSELQYVSRMGFVKHPDKKTYLGDILISREVAEKEAEMEGKSLEEYLLFLVQHGTKHLIGIHHN